MKKSLVRWLIPLVLALPVLLYLTSARTFHTEIDIPAPPEEVWRVLTDTAAYAEWNPLLVPTRGRFAAGETLAYRMTLPDGELSDFESTVVEVKVHSLIRQHAGMAFVLTADHEYRLEPVNGGTRVIQHEVDRGIAMWFWDSSWVQPSYENVNRALRKRVLESRN